MTKTLGNKILAPFRTLIRRYPNKSQRALEILPGFFSWSMILFPVWGSFLWPIGVAYYIIAFDVYWFYRSVSMAFLSLLSWYRIKASSTYDWMGDVKGFSDDWKKVYHVVVIPNYKEPTEILVRTLQSLQSQTFPAKQIIPVIACEERAGMELFEERKKTLQKNFKNVFAD